MLAYLQDQSGINTYQAKIKLENNSNTMFLQVFIIT